MHLIRISEHWQILLVLVIGFVVTGCDGSKLNSDNGLVSKAEVRLNISSDSDRVVEFPVVVSNVSARDISIVGMRADCSCAQTDLPKIVKAGQSVELVVRVVVDGLSVREPPTPNCLRGGIYDLCGCQDVSKGLLNLTLFGSSF